MGTEFGFIDTHAHLRVEPGATERLLAMMDLCGIEKAVVIAGGTITPELLSIHYLQGGSLDVEIDNEGIRTACDPTGGRLLPFFFANPLRGAQPYRQAAGGFHGLKLAPIVHGVPFTDERVHELVETAATFSHPIYLHCLPHRGFLVSDLVNLAAAHPEAKIIMGHGGVGHGDFHGISQIAKQTNIYFEISGSFSMATKVAWKVLGPERVLFGSEYPLQDPRLELLKMQVLDFPAKDYRLMMRENILRLLNGGKGAQVSRANSVRAQPIVSQNFISA